MVAMFVCRTATVHSTVFRLNRFDLQSRLHINRRGLFKDCELCYGKMKKIKPYYLNNVSPARCIDLRSNLILGLHYSYRQHHTNRVEFEALITNEYH